MADGDSTKKVTSGQRVELSATLMNDLRQMVQEWRAKRVGGAKEGAIGTGTHTGIVDVRNDSDAAVGTGGVLGITGLAITVTENADFAGGESTGLIFTGDVPATPDHVGKFLVAAEPINPGEIGRAYAWGVFACKVNIGTAGDTRADVADGDAEALASGGVGAAQILWADSGTGVKDAVVRIDGGDGGLVTFLVTTAATGAGKYNAKSITDPPATVDPDTDLTESELGTIAETEDLLVLNVTELDVSNTGHDVLETWNTDHFAVYGVGVVRGMSTDGRRVVHATHFWAGCEDEATP
jgi:hypothetical protein